MKAPEKSKYNLIPYRARLLYLCESQELHEVTLWVWLGRIVSKSDRAIVSVPALMGMLYSMAPEKVESKDSTVEPTFH